MQNLQQILGNPLFQSILKKAQHINRLNHTLHTVLPTDLNEHCRVADIESTCLILQVENGAWATRLRYETPQLLSALKVHRDFTHILSIRWQIDMQSNKKVAEKPKSFYSPHQLETINSLLLANSQNIKNAGLKASMEKLAKNISVTLQDAGI